MLRSQTQVGPGALWESVQEGQKRADAYGVCVNVVKTCGRAQTCTHLANVSVDVCGHEQECAVGRCVWMCADVC